MRGSDHVCDESPPQQTPFFSVDADILAVSSSFVITRLVVQKTAYTSMSSVFTVRKAKSSSVKNRWSFERHRKSKATFAMISRQRLTPVRLLRTAQRNLLTLIVGQSRQTQVMHLCFYPIYLSIRARRRDIIFFQKILQCRGSTTGEWVIIRKIRTITHHQHTTTKHKK